MTNILTLRIDDHAQAFFDALRTRHFPPERNHIAAHITLFHTLPDTPEIASVLNQAAAAQHPFSLSVTGLRTLGKGVAYTLASSDLHTVHRRLAAAFQCHLTPQDAQPFKPHIVVQNKVTPDRARLLLAELQQDFQPMEFKACGFDLWRYLGGPWQHVQAFPFAEQLTS